MIRQRASALLYASILKPARFELCMVFCWVLAMRWTTGRLPMLAGVVDDLSVFCLFMILFTLLRQLPTWAYRLCAWVMTLALGIYIISNDLYFAFYRGYLSPAALTHTGDAGRAGPSALMLLSWPVMTFAMILPVITLLWPKRFSQMETSRFKIPTTFWILGLSFFMLVFSFRNPIYMHAKENAFMYLLRAVQEQIGNRFEEAQLTEEERKALYQFRPQQPTADYLNEQFPLFSSPHQTTLPSTQNPKNVILIVLESVPSFEMGLYGNPVSSTPQLDKIAQQGLWASTFYANGNQTVRGELALLCGLMDRLKSAPVVTINPDLRATCIPRLLKEAGYQTHWFHGNTASFFRRAPFFLRHGYDHLHDGDHLKEITPPLKEIGWGTADEAVFNYALDVLDKEQQPFFAEIMTLSNHHPFTWDWGIKIPKYLSPQAQDVDSLYRHGIYYTDYAAGRFWQRFKNSKLAKNTLVVFVGDHGLWLFDNAKNQKEEIRNWEKYFRLPLIIVGPDVEPRELSYPSSQVDVPVTILDWLGYQVPHALLGTSLFQLGPSPRPIWMHHEADFNYRLGNTRCYTPMTECGNDRYLRCTRYENAIAPHTCYEFEGDLLTQEPEAQELKPASPQSLEQAFRGSRALQKLIKHQQIRPLLPKDLNPQR
jgi:phosphoglycerol transferase MdoB-like AlkP superfamily enzyme